MTIIILLSTIFLFLLGFYFRPKTEVIFNVHEKNLSDAQKREMRGLKNTLEYLEEYYSQAKGQNLVIDKSLIERNEILLSEKKVLESELITIQKEIDNIAKVYFNILCDENKYLVQAHSYYCDVEKLLEIDIHENLRFYINDKGDEMLRIHNHSKVVQERMDKVSSERTCETPNRNFYKENVRDYWLKRDAYPFPRI